MFGSVVKSEDDVMSGCMSSSGDVFLSVKSIIVPTRTVELKVDRSSATNAAARLYTVKVAKYPQVFPNDTLTWCHSPTADYTSSAGTLRCRESMR